MKYTIIVLCCFVYCVRCDDGYEFERPTPVIKMPTRIQSTDQLNPLKLNIQSESNIFTTGVGVLLNPTPVSKHIQTTDADSGVSDVLERKQLTTFIDAPNDNPLVNPTPVLDDITRSVTGVDIPIITNNTPLPPPLITTAVVGNGILKPTQVMFTIGAEPIAIGLSNDDEPVVNYTGNYPWNFIEPSQVSVNNGIVQTTQFEQEPNQVPSQSINGPITQSVAPCKCKYFEDRLTPALGLASYDMENALTPQFLSPEGSKPYDRELARPPNNVRQVIVSLQLNLYINNIPVLAAQAIPLYF